MPTLPRASKMYSRRKRRFWQFGVFFPDLSNAFDEVWKVGLLVKLLRTGVRHKMYM